MSGKTASALERHFIDDNTNMYDNNDITYIIV
jgi:hypothetical protein